MAVDPKIPRDVQLQLVADRIDRRPPEFADLAHATILGGEVAVLTFAYGDPLEAFVGEEAQPVKAHPFRQIALSPTAFRAFFISLVDAVKNSPAKDALGWQELVRAAEK